MEQYIVSARKYRPSTFASVVGQRHLAATLKNAIASRRLAHAYLFCGSRGVGKTSCARIFAKTINCTQRTPDGEPCNRCESCRAFNEGRAMNIVELDAASHNGIDDIKGIIEQVQVPPSSGEYRVFIIDEVHMLSAAAFNAFLKTLEEPPGYVIFILATTEKHKIIPTILSRCQIYDFSRITIHDMVEHLQYVATQEGYTADPAALNAIARKADGAMRDALSIFDQVAASSAGQITYQATIDNLNILDSAYYNRLLDAFHTKQLPEALLIYKEIRDRGFDSLFFVNGLAQYLRDLMVAQNPATAGLLEATDDIRQEMARRAAGVQPTWLYGAIDLLNEVDLNYRASSNKQLLVELALIKLCQLLSPSPKALGEGLDPIATPPAAPQAIPQPAAVQPTQSAPAAAPQASPQPAMRTISVQPAYATAPAGNVPPQGRQYQVPANGTPTAAPSLGQPKAPGAYSARPGGYGSMPGGLGPALSLQTPKTPADTEAAADTAPKRAAEYKPEQVEQLWNDYIMSHGSEKFLVAAMKKSSPVPVQGQQHIYEVAADEGALANAVREQLPAVQQWLRDRLHNDHITLQLSVVIAPDSPSVWTDRQVLDHMLKHSPELGELMTNLKLTLE